MWPATGGSAEIPTPEFGPGDGEEPEPFSLNSQPPSPASRPTFQTPLPLPVQTNRSGVSATSASFPLKHIVTNATVRGTIQSYGPSRSSSLPQDSTALLSLASSPPVVTTTLSAGISDNAAKPAVLRPAFQGSIRVNTSTSNVTSPASPRLVNGTTAAAPLVFQRVPDVPERVLFTNVQLTPHEISALNVIRPLIPPPCPPDSILLRLLRHHQGQNLTDVVSHWNMLRDWIATEHPNASKIYQQYSHLGLVYSYGSSLWGHPVVVCRALVLAQLDLRTQVLVTAHLLDTIQTKLLLPGVVEQVLFLIDMSEADLLEHSLLGFLERLDTLFCGLPAGWLFVNCDGLQYLYMTTYEVLSDSICSKAHHVTQESLSHFIDSTQLECRYGGAAGDADRFDFFYSNRKEGQTFRSISALGPTLVCRTCPLLRSMLPAPSSVDDEVARKLLQELQPKLNAESALHRCLTVRHIFSTEPEGNPVALLPWEMWTLEKLRQVLAEEIGARTPAGLSGDTNASLLRMVYSTRCDVTRCKNILRTQSAWQTNRVQACEAWKRIGQLGAVFQYGASRWGQPVIVIHARLLGASLGADLRDGTCCLLDIVRTSLLRPGAVDQWVLLINGVSATSETITQLGLLLTCIENHYPSYTAQILLRDMTSTQFPPEFQHLILQVPEDVALESWIDPSQLLIEFGGTGAAPRHYNSLHVTSAENTTYLPIPPVRFVVPRPYRGSSLHFLEKALSQGLAEPVTCSSLLSPRGTAEKTSQENDTHARPSSQHLYAHQPGQPASSAVSPRQTKTEESPKSKLPVDFAETVARQSAELNSNKHFLRHGHPISSNGSEATSEMCTSASTYYPKPSDIYYGSSEGDSFCRFLFGGTDITYTDFEVSALESVFDTLTKEGVSVEGTVFADKAAVLRFLQAVDWEVDACVERVLAHLQWREENLPVSPSEFEGLQVPRLCYVLGRDRHSRPVLVSRLKHLSATDSTTAQRYVLFTVERAIQDLMVPGKVEQMTVIVDVDGFSVFNLLSATARRLIRDLQDHYPERLHKLFLVNATTPFRLFWSMLVSPQLSPFTRDKVVILDPNSVSAGLRKNISRSQVEISLGGTLPEARLPPFKIPPLMAAPTRFL